jgi:hypothetical protein
MMAIKTFAAPVLMIFGVLSASTATAQTNSLADIQKQLTSTFQTAKATADGTDIVTAGSVLVLQKDHLLMCKTDQVAPIPNVYKGGAISQNGLHSVLGALSGLSKLGRFVPGVGAFAGVASVAGQTAVQTGARADAATREFALGEKVWVTQITTKPDGIYFTLLSDPIGDRRYKATLQFPFAKGAIPSWDDVTAQVGEVVKIDGAEQSTQQQEAQAPAPEPKTISVGQTRDEVVAAFGVPTKVIKLAAKEIDFFPDMKVTFVHNKVANVE